MRFSEKLSKLRKDNNLSQEQLAEKLGVSRQAVSKWELGSSYPDMEKMLTMCSVLNCKLDELMDDGVLGDSVEKKEYKVDLKAYLDDFLKLITSIYNMFMTMKFKEKIKFLFEQAFNFILVLFVGFLISKFIYIFFHELLIWIPYRFLDRILSIINILVNAILSILGVIVLYHLFKIRYLDYYVTIEDANVSEKTIEKSIEEKGNLRMEKIIIRDPKHSSNKFFEFLGKIFIFVFKCLISLFSLPIFFFFVCITFGIIVSLGHVGYNNVFFFISLIGVGAGLLSYVIIEYLYKFVFNMSQSLKKLFLVGITGLLLLGIGSGLTFLRVLSMDQSSDNSYTSKIEYIDYYDDIVFVNYGYSSNLEFIEDESIDNIKVIISSPKVRHGAITKSDDKNKYYLYSIDITGLDAYKYILNELKNNKFDFNSEYRDVKFQIISNKDNIEVLKNNYELNKKDN